MPRRKGDTSSKAELRRSRIHRAIVKEPGKYTTPRLATKFGVCSATIKSDLAFINDERNDFAVPVRYGSVLGRSGFYAANLKRHVRVLDQYDVYCDKVAAGIQRKRLLNLKWASKLRYCEDVVAAIEERLGVSVEELSDADLEAFEELLNEEAA